MLSVSGKLEHSAYPSILFPGIKTTDCASSSFLSDYILKAVSISLCDLEQHLSKGLRTLVVEWNMGICVEIVLKFPMERNGSNTVE